MTERGNPWTMLRLARLNAWLMMLILLEGHPRARPMDADDPFHPCRRGGPLANESWWLADHAAASEQLRQAEAGEAPLGGTARKHLGLG